MGSYARFEHYVTTLEVETCPEFWPPSPVSGPQCGPILASTALPQRVSRQNAPRDRTGRRSDGALFSRGRCVGEAPGACTTRCRRKRAGSSSEPKKREAVKFDRFAALHRWLLCHAVPSRAARCPAERQMTNYALPHVVSWHRWRGVATLLHARCSTHPGNKGLPAQRLPHG